MRPDVLIEQTDGNLGRIGASDDGITALIVSGVSVNNKFNTGEVLTFFKLQDAKDLGIDTDYDNTHQVLAFQHISDFYKGAGEGTKLYVVVVNQTFTIYHLLKTVVVNLFSKKKDIKICVITRLPQEDYKPVYDGQFDEDIIKSIPIAQDLIDFERAAPKHRYKQILIEGYGFQGNANLTYNFRELQANRVSVVIGANSEVSNREIAGKKPYKNYAFAAFIAGLRAGLPVQRNIARVKNGRIPFDNVGLSNGASLDDFNDSQLLSLHKRGLIFAWEHPTKAGYYINQDHVCTEITSDYAYSPNGRVADKVSRITRAVYVDELMDDIEVNPQTGRLEVSVVKSFQEKLKKELDKEMVNKRVKEASSIDVYVDPNQNILSTDKIEAETNVIPKGYAETIKVKQSFQNPFKND